MSQNFFDVPMTGQVIERDKCNPKNQVIYKIQTNLYIFTSGATIPTALDIRDRCQSEGNLLLVNPNNVEDNQATIVSLPFQHFEDYQDSKSIVGFIFILI